MPTVLELRSIAHSSDDGCGGFGTNAFNFGDALACFILSVHDFYLLVETADPSIKIPEQIIKLIDSITCHERKRILHIRQDLRNRSACSCNADPDGKAAIQ